MMSGSKQADRSDVDAQAAAWILRREEGALSPQERAELEAWLAADSRHRSAYLRLNEAWQFSARLRSWRPVDAPVDPDLLLAPAEQPRSTRRWPLALAAAVVLAFVAALIWFDASGTYSTKVGGFERVVLEDGSTLQLNTDSKARVRFSGRQRQVYLLRGEAYFEIARDPHRPFDVAAGNTVVRAVGTAFSVRLREARRVDVLVTQGRVVLHEKKPAIALSQSQPSTSDVTAQAGEAAEVKPTGLRIKQIQKEEIGRRLAWQQGQLHFSKEQLAVVVAEFNRYNRRRIELADPSLSGLEVHGNFKASDMDSFVAAMKNALKVRAEETHDTIRLYAE